MAKRYRQGRTMTTKLCEAAKQTMPDATCNVIAHDP